MTIVHFESHASRVRGLKLWVYNPLKPRVPTQRSCSLLKSSNSMTLKYMRLSVASECIKEMLVLTYAFF